MFKLFKNGRVLMPDFSFKLQNILLQGDNIHALFPVDKMPEVSVEMQIDIDGRYVFPGLINSHDHLVDTCWKCPLDKAYNNWYEWEQALKKTQDYIELQKLSITDLYIMGMYKNVISGATTIVDHFPREVSATFYNNPLASLLEHFYVAHSASPSQSDWGHNVTEQYNRSQSVLPFVLHAGEGIEKDEKEDIRTLDRLGVIGEHTVLAGCTFISDNDFELIRERQASVIWLPTSSQHRLNRQPDIKKILDLGIRFVIGTDSSITGSVNLLSELAKAQDYSSKILKDSLSSQTLVKAATIDAADVWGISKKQGSIMPGKRADLLIFEADSDEKCFDSFINMKPEDFSMIIHKGLLILSDDEFRRMSSLNFSHYSEVCLNGVSKLLYGRPVELLERIRHKINREVFYPFFPVTSA